MMHMIVEVHVVEKARCSDKRWQGETGGHCGGQPESGHGGAAEAVWRWVW